MLSHASVPSSSVLITIVIWSFRRGVFQSACLPICPPNPDLPRCSFFTQVPNPRSRNRCLHPCAEYEYPCSHHTQVAPFNPHVGKKLNYETQPQEKSLKRRGRLGRTLAMELVDMTRFCSIHLWALHGCMGGGGMWIAGRWLGLFTFAPFLRTAWGNPPI